MNAVRPHPGAEPQTARPWRRHTRTGVQSGWLLGDVANSRTAWLVLHGGPGSGASASLLNPFDPLHHFACAPHQQGSALISPPIGNKPSVSQLIADLEALRLSWGLERWCVLGGSWGAYLALAYLAQHPQAIDRMVLRGSFLAGLSDIWRHLNTVTGHLPAHQRPHPSPAGNRTWLLRMRRLLQSETTLLQTRPEIIAWLLAENQRALAGLTRAAQIGRWARPDQHVAARRLRGILNHDTRRLQAQQRMLQPATQAQARKVQEQVRLLSTDLHGGLRRAMPKWKVRLSQDLNSGEPSRPVVQLLQGRWDRVCHPSNARRLHQLLSALSADSDTIRLIMVDSGHLATEPAMQAALRQAIGD